MDNKNSISLVFLVALLFVFIVFIKSHSVITYRSPHTDSYYHSVLASIVCTRANLRDIDIPYASLPFYFLYQCIISQILGGAFDEMINTCNYLYLMFILIVVTYLYMIMVYSFSPKLKTKEVMVGILVYILPYTVGYLYYPTAAPHIYSLVLYLGMLHILSRTFLYQQPLRLNSGLLITICLMNLAISYSHHLTQLILLTFVIIMVMVDLIMFKRINRSTRDKINVSIAVVLVVLFSMMYSWATVGFSRVIKDVITSILSEGLTEGVRSAVMISGINLPWITYLLIHIKRVLMIVYIIIPLFMIMKKIISAIIDTKAPLDHETRFYIAYIAGIIPSIITAPIALERPFIFLAPLLLLQVARLIVLYRKLLLTMIIVMLSFSLSIVTFLHVELYYGIGAPHIKYAEDQTINTIANLLTETIYRNCRIFTDFWTTGILRYYTTTNLLATSLNINHVIDLIYTIAINEYHGAEYSSAICHLNIATCGVFIITERTIIRIHVFYPNITIDLHSLATNLNLVFNSYHGFILVIY